MTAAALKQAALAYAQRGWKVFPVYEIAASGACSCPTGGNCNRPGKHPRILNGVNGASSERDQIERWWTKWPEASIGIATGKVSNLTVIDADAGKGKPGLANLTKLAAKNGGLPETVQVQTGGGGLHVCLAYTPDLRTGTNVLAEAIDVRNDGAYIVAPPSRHVSGRPYAFVNGTQKLAPAPAWMLPAARETDPTPAKRRGRKPRNLTIEQVAEALDHIDPDDRDRWLSVGIILGRAFDQREAAWQAYEQWSMRSPKFDEDRVGNMARMREAFYKRSAEKSRRGEELTLGSLIAWAQEGGWSAQTTSLGRYEKFWAVRPAAKFLYVPSGQLWTAQAVNDALPPRMIGMNDKGEPIYQSPAEWLGQNRGIDSLVFDPALPQIVADKVAREQGVLDDPGATLFNRYFPPQLKLGDPAGAAPFVEHLHKLFPATTEADHIVAWLAHRVQRPGQKVRHALLIGGPPGVGKDTIVEAVIPAVGAWNVASINPDEIFTPFNEYAASVLLRINEVVDLHDISRFKFYEATKTLIAGAPEYVAVNQKYGVKFHVRNCAGVIMTTNYGSTGMYLTADDRRHFAVETVELWGTQNERDEYFRKLWAWLYEGDGFAHVAAFMHSVDLRSFNPNAPPPKTQTFWKIAASSTSGDGWLIDALDELGRPAMLRVDTLREAVDGSMSRNEIARSLGPAMARQGFEIYPNPQRTDGRHNFMATGRDGKERRVVVVVYVKRGTPAAELGELFTSLKGPDDGNAF